MKKFHFQIGFFIIFGLLCAAASDFFYRNVLVDSLSDYQEVPFFLWTVVYMPNLLALGVIGSLSKTVNAVACLTFLVVVANQLYGVYASFCGHIGYLKSFAKEDIIYYWVVITAATWLFFAIGALGFYWAIKKIRGLLTKKSHQKN